MMHKDLFSDGVARIDPDAVERTLRFEQELAQRAAGRRRRRVLTVLAAALLTVMLTSVLLIVPFIPKTYDLNYEMPKHQSSGTTVRVYYANENGKLQSERVKMPDSAQNVFLTWQHLNEVDEQVQLLDYQITTEPMAGTTVVPDTLWEFVMQQMGKRDEQTIVTATLSAGITSYENQDALIESLIQTIAKYAGISPEQIRILIDGETIGIIGPLQFWHNLQGGGDVIIGTGDTLEITVGMTNISDEIIHYTGSSSAFVPDATLRLGNTVIEHEIYPHTEDEVALTLAPGESREVTYRFTIPADAPTGSYDLILSFGEAKMTFEGAVEVVVFTVTGNEYLQFAEFLNNYGFTSASSTKFRWALDNFQYQGSNVFTHMNEAAAEWSPGFNGEYWIGDFCEYLTMTFNSGSTAHVQKSTFTAMALPDNVTLPVGICPDDSLTDALAKLGFSNMQEIVEQQQNSVLITTETCYLSLQFDKIYASINYCDMIQNGDTTVARQMHLKYDLATEKFYYLYICAASSNFSLPITITRTYHGQAVNWKLSDEQSLRLLEAVNTGNWELDWPIRTDFTLSPTFSFNGDSMLFEETWFLDQGCAVEVSRSLVKELLDSFTLYEGMVAFDFPVSDDALAYVELDEQHTQALLNKLNCGKWLQGVPEIASTMYCQVGDQDLKYDPDLGIFIENDRVLFLSAEEKQIIDAILDPYM